MKAESGEAGRFVVLDGMRGLAAFVVIADHVNAEWITPLTPGRYLAVDFFFVLSGFVLSHVYGRRLAAGMSASAFMLARLVRLYPLYLLGLALGVSLTAWSMFTTEPDPWWMPIAESFGLNLAFLPSPHGIFPFDPPAWSLFFELFANLCFALLFLRLSPGVLAGIIGAAACALVVCAVHFGRLDVGFSNGNFVGGFPRVLYGFFIGVAVHRYSLHRPPPRFPAFASLAALLLLVAMPALGRDRAAIDLVVVLGAVPVLVYLSAGSRVTGGAARSMSWLGAMSYGVYILHFPLLRAIELAISHWAPNAPAPGWVLYIMTAAVAIVATGSLNAAYDLPVRALLTRRFLRK